MTDAFHPGVSSLPETPLEALGPLVREAVIIEGRTFHITHPDGFDRSLDHPAVRSSFAADEFLPYWADLWPAARMLAKAVMREPWSPGLEALEVGCGLGLPGIAALARGLRVIFSDCDATALRFAADNARANGFHNFRTLQFDWRQPPADLRVPVILASDLLYEGRHVAPLVKLIKKLLLPDGICLMTDEDRPPAHLLRELLPQYGLQFTRQVMHAGIPGGRRFRGTLYRIHHVL
ncbi:MAG: methyltransferase domain-containing protein [Gemmataceae bacterium]|nr:methyltransferase domain-containing protein [Gemmataceae bacterium]MDW8265582.1 methyltransferase domain-containing protein [Gemmataceae bacterium]